MKIGKQHFIPQIICILVFALIMCACSKENNADNNNQEIISTPVAIEQNQNWQESFLSDLENNDYLPDQVLKALPDFKENKNEDGSTFYIWSKWDDEKDDYVHNIQMIAKDDELLEYHYKSYYFKVPHLEKSLSHKSANTLVNNFAKTFLYDAEELLFENDPENQIQSLYNPNHVETWTATSNSGTHSIVVNLDIGGIVFYKFDD